MEKPRPNPPIREYAPGITDPVEFARLVEENTFYQKGSYRTPTGRAEMSRALYDIRTARAQKAWDAIVDPTVVLENPQTSLIQDAVMEHIIFHGELFY